MHRHEDSFDSSIPTEINQGPMERRLEEEHSIHRSAEVRHLIHLMVKTADLLRSRIPLIVSMVSSVTDHQHVGDYAMVVKALGEDAEALVSCVYQTPDPHCSCLPS